jgi:AraC-like DNA-binding protein
MHVDQSPDSATDTTGWPCPTACTPGHARSIVSFVPAQATRAVGTGGAPVVPYLDAVAFAALATVGDWARGLPPAHASLAGALGALVRTWGRQAGPLAMVPGGLAAWQFAKALHMLADHLPTGIELDDIAAACRLSRAHFAKAFRRSAGVPPYRWRLARRLCAARVALAEGTTPLAQVARSLGFPHMAHFSHAFARATGMSPRQWRHRFRSTAWSVQADGHEVAGTRHPLSPAAHLELLHDAEDPVAGALQSLLMAACEHRDAHGAPARVLVAALVLRSRAARWHGAPGEPRRGQLQAWQEGLARHLLDNAEASRVAEAAHACGMTSASFSRAFSATFGVCPRTWQAQARVARAKVLLEQSSRMMIDIAGACGFAEQSHFNHTFARLAGCNPGAWRRRHQASLAAQLPPPRRRRA